MRAAPHLSVLAATLWAASPVAGLNPIYNRAMNMTASTNTTGPPPPSSDPFYTVPQGLAQLAPGTVIKYRRPPSPITAFATAADKYLKETWQFLYRTTGRDMNATATVLTVLIPQNADFGKVVSLEAAEDATSIDCAPSFGFQNASSFYPDLESPTAQLQVLIAEDLLSRGIIVIVPDIQGPEAAYPPNEVGAYSSLDGIRAALSSTALTGIKRNARVGIWGYSGGASAALSAVQAMPSYAPNLNIVGAAFGGGGGDIPSSLDVPKFLNKTPAAALVVIGILGAAAQSPDFEKKMFQHLKPEWRDHFLKAKHQCLDAAKDYYNGEDILSFFDDSSFLSEIQQFQRPAYHTVAPKVPIYWYQSAIDQLTPANLAESTSKQFCDQGANIHFVLDTVQNVSHASYSVFGTERSLDWLNAVLSGYRSPPGCSNETLATKGVPRKFLNLFPPSIQDQINHLALSMAG